MAASKLGSDEWDLGYNTIPECEDDAQNAGGYCKEDYVAVSDTYFDGVIYRCDDNGSGQCSDRCYGKTHHYFDDVDGTYIRTEWDCCPLNNWGQSRIKF